MAGVYCSMRLPPSPTQKPKWRMNSSDKPQTPQLLKIAVSGVNKFLRLFSSTNKLRDRTYFRLPWRPFILVDGRTVYDLDNEFKIVRHSESWNVSALQAVAQIFTPNFQRPG